MDWRFTLLWGLWAVLLAPAAIAESTDCANPDIIVSDGRQNLSTFVAPPPGKSNTTYWYGFFGQSGHSYSVEFVSPSDNDPIRNDTTVAFNSFQVWGPKDVLISCGGNSSVSKVATYSYSPVLMRTPGYGDGERFSFVASSSGLYLMTMSNSGGTGGYSFRVVDTTLFNPRWSTWTGYDSQWGFMNLSDMDIPGTLSVYDLTGKLLKTVSMTIPAGAIVQRFTGSSDLKLPRNTSGYAIFTHTGPPGALLADAYMLNGDATVVIAAKFEVRAPQ